MSDPREELKRLREQGRKLQKQHALFERSTHRAADKERER